MGRHGGVGWVTRVVMGPSPGLRRVHHAQTAVFSHATAVTSLRTTRTQGTVKRRYGVQTEPALASNLFVTRPTKSKKLSEDR
jgi:hypothetical protein